MNNCRGCQRELSALLDGELAAARRVEVEAHVAGCADCRERLTGLRQVVAGVTALPQLPPPPQFVAEMRRKIRGEARQSWFDTLFRPVWWKVPLEAVALVAMLGTVLVLVNMPRHRKTETATLAYRAEQAQDAKKDLLAMAGPAPMPTGPLAAGEMKSAVAKKQFLEMPMAAAAPVARPTPAKPSELARQLAVETITIEDADAVAVQKEAEQVAVALDGRMLPGQTAAQNFQVEVPRRNVVAFKSQLMQVTSRQQQWAYLRSRSDNRTGAVAGAMTLATADKAKEQESDVGTTVLEIRVVPPR
jgi:hypothetical protein